MRKKKRKIKEIKNVFIFGACAAVSGAATMLGINALPVMATEDVGEEVTIGENKAGPLRIIGEELEALRKRIIANHEAAGQVASGRTKGSLKVEMSEDGGVLWGRQAFAVLETGRGPGKVPKGFYKIIRQWVEDKGIQVKKPDSFAYLVARKIAKDGTELYRNRKHEEIYSRDLENTMDNIASRVSTIYETEVEHINLNFDNENTYDR